MWTITACSITTWCFLGTIGQMPAAAAATKSSSQMCCPFGSCTRLSWGQTEKENSRLDQVKLHQFDNLNSNSLELGLSAFVLVSMFLAPHN